MIPKVEIEIREHNGYVEWKKAKKKGHKINLYFGHHQFIYKRLGNEISLVELKAGLSDEDRWYWEIYCIKGNLFEDTERFASKQEAEDRIMALLTPDEQL